MAVASQYAFTGRLVQMLAEVTARGRRRFASAPAMPAGPARSVRRAHPNLRRESEDRSGRRPNLRREIGAANSCIADSRAGVLIPYFAIGSVRSEVERT